MLLSMADLFSYLLPYPGSVLCRTLIPNLNFVVSLLVFLIVTALFGQFKKIIPHYRTEGVSIQSHLQLNVPRLSYGSTAIVISTDMGKKK